MLDKNSSVEKASWSVDIEQSRRARHQNSAKYVYLEKKLFSCLNSCCKDNFSSFICSILLVEKHGFDIIKCMIRVEEKGENVRRRYDWTHTHVTFAYNWVTGPFILDLHISFFHFLWDAFSAAVAATGSGKWLTRFNATYFVIISPSF